MLIIAQTQDWITTLPAAGILSGVLSWFMLRNEVRLRGVENSNNRMTRAVLLLVVSLQQANAATKAEARSILAEVDEAEKRGRHETNDN